MYNDVYYLRVCVCGGGALGGGGGRKTLPLNSNGEATGACKTNEKLGFCKLCVHAFTCNYKRVYTFSMIYAK